MPEEPSEWQKTHPWEPSPTSHPEPIPLISASDLVNPMLKVGEVMTANPRSCSTFSTAVEAALIFRDAGCGLVPVTEAGHPVGVLTDRHLALALPDRNGDLSGAAVGDLMSVDVVTIPADATLDVALGRLGDAGGRRLLIVDAEGNLRGVLSWTDLVPHVSAHALRDLLARILANR
jgi:CBS domain-containing protein